MSTALFVDSFSRRLTVSTVSVSQVADKGLVLRYGAEVGNLWQLTNDAYEGVFENTDLPVIVATRGYQARSSAGFTRVVVDYHGNPTRLETRVLGVQGMPWQTRKGLSVLTNPMEVIVLRPGTNIAVLDTHARRKPNEGWHSNPDAAAAALTGIELRAKIRPNSVFLVEGQSDYAQAWELATTNYAAGTQAYSPEFPEEFRQERFSDEALALRTLRGVKEEDDAVFFPALAAAVAELEPNDAWGYGGRFAQPITGLSNHQWSTLIKGAHQVLAQKKEEGFELFLVYNPGELGVATQSPNDEGTLNRFYPFGDNLLAYALEDRLLDLADNSAEDKVEFRRKRRAELLQRYLTRITGNDAPDYEKEHYAQLAGGTTYRLVPVWSVGDWKFRPQPQLEGLAAKTLPELFADARLETLANTADTFFLVSYDEEGNPQAAQYVHWGWGFGGFGWQRVVTHLDMLVEIPPAPVFQPEDPPADSSKVAHYLGDLAEAVAERVANATEAKPYGK